MNLSQLGRLREGVYRFTATGFSPPSAELQDVSAGSVAVLDDLGLFDFAFALPVVDAAQALAAADPRDLEGAHAALFEAGVGGAACSPHAATYVADPRTGEVARVQASIGLTYRRLGFADLVADLDMVDHITTELEVMARLCDDEVRRRGTGDDPNVVVELQHEFMSECVEPWIPIFARRVCEADRDPAYTALAMALHAFIEHERELIPMLLAPMGCES